MNKEITDKLINAKTGQTVEIGGYNFIIEMNETGCFRAVASDIIAADEDKAFFSSRCTAIDVYTAALSVQDYNVNIVNNIQKARLELLEFITDRKEKLCLEDTNLDFDGNVYFIQISHGPSCKNH